MDINALFHGGERAFSALFLALVASLIFSQGRNFALAKNEDTNERFLVRILRGAAIAGLIALLTASRLGTTSTCEGYDNYGSYGCETTTEFEATDEQRSEEFVYLFLLYFTPFLLGVLLRRQAIMKKIQRTQR